MPKMTSVTRELSSLPVIFAIWLPRLNTLSTILPMALWFVAFFVISLRAFAISVFSFLAVPEAFAAFPAPFSVTDLSRAALPSGDSASASSGASVPSRFLVEDRVSSSPSSSGLSTTFCEAKPAARSSFAATATSMPVAKEATFTPSSTAVPMHCRSFDHEKFDLRWSFCRPAWKVPP